jgi:LmbE family N-acetylglucosaminyl deacetylase
MTDLLLIVPHPDDEVFGVGGVLARTVASGRTAATLTLTRGRAGRTLGLCSQEELPALREQELRGSLAALGVKDVTILDHPDFVPDAERGLPPHRGLETVPAEQLIAEIRSAIERTEPRTIVTFGPNGSNGHPDHVCTHHRVHEALERSDHRPEALYYFASTTPYHGGSRPGFLDPDEIRGLQLLATHHVPVGDFMTTKLRAIGHHRSQALSVATFLRDLADRLVTETFHRADPPYVGEPALNEDAL